MIRPLVLLGLALGGSASAQAATITILPGTGFNDTTPFTAVGGNNATTLGQARLNLFQKAGQLWGARLTSTVTIYVSADFVVQTCSNTSGQLGGAGANGNFKNFTNAPKPNVYYPTALANALAGFRVDHSDPTTDRTTADIGADFNSDVDTNPNCLNGRGFYYGFDNNPGTKIDLLNVVMHEVGHGLGFSSFVDESTGISYAGSSTQLGIYDQFVFDETQNKFWPNLTASQRISSAINDSHLVWNAAFVNGAKSALTAGVTAAGHVQLYAPTTDEPGSSVSHWDDPAVSPHLLLQPFAHSDVKVSRGVDFTLCLLKDLGWQSAAGFDCPDNLTGNSAPVANPQALQTNQNTNLPVTLTASDANGDPLTFTITVAPAHGSLTGTVPSLTYVPATNYFGADSFQFIANDGKVNSQPAAVSITVNKVNHAPVAVAQSVQAVQDTAKAIVLAATDADGDALTYSIVTPPAHGSLGGAAPNVTYTPSAGFTGTDSFTFKATDTSNAASNVATVGITVAAPVPTSASGGGGGGGGAMPNLTALALLVGWRRLRRQRALRV